MDSSRRNFLRLAGMAAGGGLLGGAGFALGSGKPSRTPDPVGILVDTTRCLGCRTCEMVCSEKNGLPEPARMDDDGVFDKERTTSETSFTVVNRFATAAGPVFVKRQCMHCLQPACAAACLVKAMARTREGPVVWREDRCMGCRYCMLSCPFDIPKFEYNSTVPKIRKCLMCHDRVQTGGLPACVENCPGEALLFGKRSKLIEEARSRIYTNPGTYKSHVYGEHEAGGTSVLVLASASFSRLGFRRDVGLTPYPELTKGFLYSVPVVLLLWPLFMLGLSQGRGRKEGG